MAVRNSVKIIALLIMLLKTVTASGNREDVVSIKVLLVAGEGVSVDSTGSVKLMEQQEHKIRFIGNGVVNISSVAITKNEGNRGDECILGEGDQEINIVELLGDDNGLFVLNLPFIDEDYRYVCVKEILSSNENNNETRTTWLHQ
ncbi:hypothetical protein LOTGIDRAFT_174893, partial [Lottia gigantea]